MVNLFEKRVQILMERRAILSTTNVSLRIFNKRLEVKIKCVKLKVRELFELSRELILA